MHEAHARCTCAWHAHVARARATCGPCCARASVHARACRKQQVLPGIGLAPERVGLIVHTLGVVLASISPISSWIGLQIGYVSGVYKQVGSTADPFMATMATIPYRFFPLLMFALIPILLLSKKVCRCSPSRLSPPRPAPYARPVHRPRPHPYRRYARCPPQAHACARARVHAMCMCVSVLVVCACACPCDAHVHVRAHAMCMCMRAGHRPDGGVRAPN